MFPPGMLDAISFSMRTDRVVYRYFGRNSVQKFGTVCTAISTFLFAQWPPGTQMHNVGGVGIGLGAMLGQLGSVMPTEVKPDLQPQ